MKLLSDVNESIRSTIHIDRLTALPVYQPRDFSNLRVNHHMGSGCFLDAPGYPSYFLRSIYTMAGDSPQTGPQQVITYEDINYVIERENTEYEQKLALLKRLYKPLPWGHPRVEAWLNHMFQHWRHCYRDVEHPEWGKPGILIYPLPNYKLEPVIIPNPTMYTAEYIEKHFVPRQEAARQKNAELLAAADRIATFDNHLAVIHAREVYPDAPVEALQYRIDRSTSDRGLWYARELERPTRETCQGDPSLQNLYPHRTDSRCQYCGYGPDQETT